MSTLREKTSLALNLISGLRALRRITREKYSWEQIFDEAVNFAGGFLNPLQIKSEIVQFLSIVEQLQPRYVLEIGTAQGGNFFLLTRAAAPDATLISLDLPGGLGGGGYSEWKTHVYQQLTLPRQKAAFIRGDSHATVSLKAVRQALAGNAVDLLFIDGDHTYEGVKQDYEMYSPLVRRGGVVALHDIVPNPAPECKVDLFWNELKAQAAVEEIVENWGQGTMGIGIVRNGTHPSEQ